MSDEQQQGAFGMWAEMFGLGDMVKTIQSGDFQSRLKAFADAVVATEARTQRIDSYCYAIMERLQAIESRLDKASRNESPGIRHPELSLGNDAAGTGRYPPAGGVADDGDRGTAKADSGNAANPDSAGGPFQRGKAA